MAERPRTGPTEQPRHPPETQECPVCGHPMGNQKGSPDAICRNCGYKEACCE